jgi:hypothetical protein
MLDLSANKNAASSRTLRSSTFSISNGTTTNFRAVLLALLECGLLEDESESLAEETSSVVVKLTLLILQSLAELTFLK